MRHKPRRPDPDDYASKAANDFWGRSRIPQDNSGSPRQMGEWAALQRALDAVTTKAKV